MKYTAKEEEEEDDDNDDEVKWDRVSNAIDKSGFGWSEMIVRAQRSEQMRIVNELLL